MKNLSTSKTFFFLLLFISTAAIFHSCVKEQEFLHNPLTPINGNTYTPSPQDEIITTSIFGLVIDENDNPVPYSKVFLQTLRGLQTTITDADGNFLYTNVMVPKNGALLKVKNWSNFNAFRRMSLAGNNYNYIKIKILSKKFLGELPSMEGGLLEDTTSSAKLELQANSVRKKNGEDYTGNVRVNMSWIDPTAEDLTERMIGDLSGIDKDGKQVALGTFGMLSVELRGENWEQLQLKEGTPAILSFPIPSEILNQAPPTIPLWSFDETLGIWEEEGFAVLQDGFYVGEVAHFSSWNVDTKTDPISVRGKVFVRVDEDEIEASYLQVYVNIEGVRVGGFLDDSGEFEFFNFPANTAFTLSILDPCGAFLWEEELGPYAENTNLETIVIQSSENNFVTINGSGIDCDGNAVENGYVKFSLNNFYSIHPLKEDGTFEFVANICNETEGEVRLTDLNNIKLSLPQTIDITANSPITMNTIVACAEAESFIEVKLNGEDWIKYLFSKALIRTNGITILSSEDDTPIPDNDVTTEIVLISLPKDTEIGTYNNLSFHSGIGTIVNNELIDIQLSLSKTIVVEITEFGNNLGDIIRGTFYEEEINPETGEITYPISGSFKAIVQ